MSERLLTYLKQLAETSVAKAKVDMNSINATRAEYDRQQSTVKNLRNALGTKEKKEEEVEEVEEEDEFFVDNPDDGQKSEPKKKAPAKKVVSKEPEQEPKEKEREPKKAGLPKRMSHEFPNAEDISLDMITDRLNIIRSGKSIRDEKVSVEMKHYFDSLNSPERLALLSFLTGLAEVVTSGVAGEDAPDPGDIGVDVKVVSTASKEKPKQQHQANKPQQSSSSKYSGSEDITPPIVVGPNTATESLKRKIRKVIA